MATTCSMPVLIPRYVHAAVVHGTAMLGAKAASHRPRPDAAAEPETLWSIMDRMSKPSRLVEPGTDPAEKALLDAKYDVFFEMCASQQRYRSRVDEAVEKWATTEGGDAETLV